jgi:threonine aldolase
MRAAIAGAVTGDDALGDDPTVRELERRIAEILGKEASLFFPSGIMANQTALLLHGARGTEVICEATSHVIDWELAGAAANAGLQLRGVATDDGLLAADAVEAAIRPRSAKLQLQTSLITVENTHNAAGGRVMPIATARDIHAVAQRHGLPVHLDGARLWNAATASGVAETEFAAYADTITITLSKGLGCPVGSMLAGAADLMERARIVRRRLGGSMRQAGILAGAGLYALDHHRERLADDHARAARLAQLARGLTGVEVVEPETNIVMFDIVQRDLTASGVVDRLKQQGVLMTEFSATRVRAVTHLDVDDTGIQRASDALRAIFT